MIKHNKMIEIAFGNYKANIIGLTTHVYGNNTMAVVAHIRRYQGIVISINLEPVNSLLLGEGEFFVKNYSEGKPFADVLIEAGWLVPTGVIGRQGFIACPACRIGKAAIILER